MKYIASILWFLSWPVVIIATYKLSQIALRLFEKNLETEETE